jgi:hypothetical protein
LHDALGRIRHQHARRARIGEPLPLSVYVAIRNSGPCAYCGTPASQVDHIRPLARGGADTADNLAPACGQCNRSKGARLLIEWIPALVEHGAANSANIAAEYARQLTESKGIPVMTSTNAPNRSAFRWAGHLLIAAVMASAASMSWSNLYRFAEHTMHWSSWHAALVPIGLDIAALACALLALDTVMRNDSAVSFRLLTAALISLSAFLNWRETLGTHNIAEEVFFPAMSVLSYAMVDSVIRKSRRDVRRDRMGLSARPAPQPLPRHGAAAWLRYPGRAFAATSAAIETRLGDPPAIRTTAAQVASDDTATRQRDYASGVVDGVSQADAIRTALAELGDARPSEVVAWLAENGRPGVAPQRVNDVIRRDREGGKHRALYAIGDGDAGTDGEAAETAS